MAGFRWGQTGPERKIHWKACHFLARPKAGGGLGFRDFECFNLALLSKQSWRIIQELEALYVRVLKGLYFPPQIFH